MSTQTDDNNNSNDTNSDQLNLPLAKKINGNRLRIICPPHKEHDVPTLAMLNDSVCMQHLPAMAKTDCGGWSLEEVELKREEKVRLFQQRAAWAGVIEVNNQLSTTTTTTTTTTTQNSSSSSSSSNNHTFAGLCGLRSIDRWNRSGEMGIIVDREFWCRGIAAEVHLLALTYCFEELRLNRVTFVTSASNTPMIRFCQECMCATLEGVLRDMFPLQTIAAIPPPADLTTDVINDKDGIKTSPPYKSQSAAAAAAADNSAANDTTCSSKIDNNNSSSNSNGNGNGYEDAMLFAILSREWMAPNGGCKGRLERRVQAALTKEGCGGSVTLNVNVNVSDSVTHADFNNPKGTVDD